MHLPSERELLESLLRLAEKTERREIRIERFLLILLRGEGELKMKAQDLLDQESAGLTALEASDKAILQKLADAEASGDELTDAEVTEGQQVLARLQALQAGDDAAVAGTTDTTPPVTDPTTAPVGDEPVDSGTEDDGTTVTDGSDGSAVSQ